MVFYFLSSTKYFSLHNISLYLGNFTGFQAIFFEISNWVSLLELEIKVEKLRGGNINQVALRTDQPPDTLVSNMNSWSRHIIACLCCRSVWITSEKLLRVVLTNVFDYFAMRVRVWASRSDVTCDPRPFCSLSCYARPTLQILVTNLHQNWKSSVKTRGNNRQLIRTNVTDFME